MSQSSWSTDEPDVSRPHTEQASDVTEIDAASERTGVPEVDQVLAEIESVGELPVADRVEVFERAHDQLRRALDADPTSRIAAAVTQ